VRGVGPGTVLGGRYTVHQRLEERHDTERWSADDTTLGRRVSVLCIGIDDHRTAALLDAARRAGSLSHPVFVRILDVGHDDDVAYVVEEDLDDARDLAQLVDEGGVPGDEVRRITGEVAAALESARHRGMHHLDLKPEDVLRTPDGDIRLRGLETAAVRIGEESTDAEDAGRRDAVGVVALAYAGLTGLWPLGAGSSGLAAAPRAPGGVAAPSEVAAGVPRDLDALCRLTLNEDQGPTNPGDYARQVAPWPSRQVVGRPVARMAAAPAAAAAVAAAHLGAGEASAPEQVTEAEPVGRSPRSCRPSTPEHPWTSWSPSMPRRRWTTRWPYPWWPVPAAAEVRGDDLSDEAEPDDEAGTDLEPIEGGSPRRTASGSAAAAGAAVAGAGAAVAGALGTVGGRVGDMAKRAVDKVAELSPDTAPRTSADGLEAPAPLVPAEPLSKDESKLALGIVASFLVLALVIGVWGMSRIGSSTREIFGGDAAAPFPSASAASPSPSASGSAPAPAESAGPPEPLAILQVEAYDPEGDGEENNKLTPKIYDGDLTTGWYSENYRTEAFGGLKKGLGVVVDLGPNKKPQTVELVIPTQTSVEVYVGPENRREGATKIGEKEMAQGRVTFDVPADVSGQYVVVWFTQLSTDGDGKRRAWLNEVIVTG
jgi:hypothetical protein